MTRHHQATPGVSSSVRGLVGAETLDQHLGEYPYLALQVLPRGPDDKDAEFWNGIAWHHWN
jgi:hypothetical protein